VIDFLKKLGAVLLNGIGHILSDIIHGHLKAVLEDIQALLHALHNLFAPLIAWLRKLQAIQRQYQLQTMRRIVNLIQRARQILVVFRLLHLKFAQKLDNWLAGIEGKIITRELDIAKKTNEILGWVDFVTDPFGALRARLCSDPSGHYCAHWRARRARQTWTRCSHSSRGTAAARRPAYPGTSTPATSACRLPRAPGTMPTCTRARVLHWHGSTVS